MQTVAISHSVSQWMTVLVWGRQTTDPFYSETSALYLIPSKWLPGPFRCGRVSEAFVRFWCWQLGRSAVLGKGQPMMTNPSIISISAIMTSLLGAWVTTYSQFDESSGLCLLSRLINCSNFLKFCSLGNILCDFSISQLTVHTTGICWLTFTNRSTGRLY